MVATFPCRHQTGMWSIGLVHELALMGFNHLPVISFDGIWVLYTF